MVYAPSHPIHAKLISFIAFAVMYFPKNASTAAINAIYWPRLTDLHIIHNINTTRPQRSTNTLSMCANTVV